MKSTILDHRRNMKDAVKDKKRSGENWFPLMEGVDDL